MEVSKTHFSFTTTLAIRFLVLLLTLGGILAVVFSYRGTNPIPDDAGGLFETGTISVSDREIPVLIARTPQALEHGLSNFKTLSPYDGMLFVFEEPARYSFWMKDMYFPLDIVWIDSSGEVVDIMYDLKPESYPDQSFLPRVPAQYVLEVPSGMAQTLAISLGTRVSTP